MRCRVRGVVLTPRTAVVRERSALPSAAQRVVADVVPLQFVVNHGFCHDALLEASLTCAKDRRPWFVWGVAEIGADHIVISGEGATHRLREVLRLETTFRLRQVEMDGGQIPTAASGRSGCGSWHFGCQLLMVTLIGFERLDQGRRFHPPDIVEAILAV